MESRLDASPSRGPGSHLTSGTSCLILWPSALGPDRRPCLCACSSAHSLIGARATAIVRDIGKARWLVSGRVAGHTRRHAPPAVPAACPAGLAITGPPCFNAISLRPLLLQSVPHRSILLFRMNPRFVGRVVPGYAGCIVLLLWRAARLTPRAYAAA